jgi:hypothetical protein
MGRSPAVKLLDVYQTAGKVFARDIPLCDAVSQGIYPPACVRMAYSVVMQDYTAINIIRAGVSSIRLRLLAVLRRGA